MFNTSQPFKFTKREQKIKKAEKKAWVATIKLGVIVFLGFVILIILAA